MNIEIKRFCRIFGPIIYHYISEQHRIDGLISPWFCQVFDLTPPVILSKTSKAQARAVLDVTLGILYSNANKERRLGLHVASDWDDMLSLMKGFNDLETDLPASAFYTNEFLP